VSSANTETSHARCTCGPTHGHGTTERSTSCCADARALSSPDTTKTPSTLGQGDRLGSVQSRCFEFASWKWIELTTQAFLLARIA